MAHVTLVNLMEILIQHINVNFIQEQIFHGSQTDSLDLYSCCDGTVVQVVVGVTGTSPALGNQVLIRRTSDGLYFRYCHLLNGSNNHLVVGQNVNTSTKIGVMGNTGKSFGTHLHFECATTYNWQCTTFLDPRCCFRFWKCKRNLCNL